MSTSIKDSKVKDKEINIKKLLGLRIKEFRTKKGFTQEVLAEKIGIGVRNLSKIECGNNFVTAENLAKIILALEVEPVDLFNFSHHNDVTIIKSELLNAIQNEVIDLSMLYRFYKSIK